MNYIVVDLDNCIADDLWRRPMIRQYETDPHRRYHDYFSMAKMDALGNAHLLTTPYEIVICTSRPEPYRQITEAWLHEHGVITRAVLMRPAGDHRPTVEMKWAMLFRYMVEREHDGGLVACAYDDRLDIVEMYRTMGLRAERVWIHQHAQGEP